MTLAQRIRSSLALALFVGVTMVVPTADALWYHAGSTQAQVRHIESADGPACHAEACVLGASAASVSPVAGIDVPPRFEAPWQSVPLAQRDHIVRARPPVFTPPSRAPPA